MMKILISFIFWLPFLSKVMLFFLTLFDPIWTQSSRLLRCLMGSHTRFIVGSIWLLYLTNFKWKCADFFINVWTWWNYVGWKLIYPVNNTVVQFFLFQWIISAHFTLLTAISYTCSVNILFLWIMATFTSVSIVDSLFYGIEHTCNGSFLTHWGRGHLNCLNARSRGLHNLKQLL